MMTNPTNSLLAALEPCPFCGDTPSTIPFGDPRGDFGKPCGYVLIKCNGSEGGKQQQADGTLRDHVECLVEPEVEAPTEAEAIAAWNRRALSSAPAVCEAMEHMASAFAKVFYGPAFDPSARPEAYGLIEQGMRAAMIAHPTAAVAGEGEAMREAAAKIVDEHGETWGLAYRSMTDTLSKAIRAIPSLSQPAAVAGEGEIPWCFDMGKMHGVNEVAFDTGFSSAYIRVCEQVIVEPTLVDGFPVPRDQWKYGYRYDEKLTDTTGRAYAWRPVPVPPVPLAGKIAHSSAVAGEGEPSDATIAAKARLALGTWLSWPDAPRDGPRQVSNEQVESWLSGLPSRLASLSQPAGDALLREILLICEEAAYSCAPCKVDCGPVKAVNEIHERVTANLASTKSPDGRGLLCAP